MHKLSNWISSEIDDYKRLLRAIPSLTVSIFILSVVCMNLMANKALVETKWLCVDCGLTLSWISFLCMDCICKRFGAKAAVKINILAMSINVLTVIFFKLLAMAPGNWAEGYSAPDAQTTILINNSLNATFGGTWYVVLGSATAMLISGIVNALLNATIGKKVNNKTFKGFAFRSLASTSIAQWVDNFVFTSLVSHIFFGWNWTQVLICATTNMILELVAEAIFTPIGYKISQDWEKDEVGSTYLKAAS